MAIKFKKWNDLNQFHEVRKNFNYPRIWQALKDNDSKIAFGFKIKLHGTNACVRIEPDGKVTAQKRSGDITPENDNAGFARWVSDNEAYFARLAATDATRYVYGEWAGPGVQKGVACSMTELKHFYVFAVDENLEYENEVLRHYDPNRIEEILTEHMPDQVIVIPWHIQLDIDFEDPKQTAAVMARLNSEVESIGECDPLIKFLFDIEGAGEGLVAYPLMGRDHGIYHLDEEYFSWFNFKAKSEHHRVNKTKTAVQFDPEKFAGIQAFADFYVTEQRLLQALNESINGELDMRRTSDFVGWVVKDIFKESTTEREANPELDWKACSKACSTKAVLWFKKKVMEI